MTTIENIENIRVETALPNEWTLWEFFKMESTSEDYHLLLKQVASLRTVGDFSKCMSYLPHGSPSQLFYDAASKQNLKFNTEEEKWKIIETLCLFRAGIHPSFEDEHNSNGGGAYFLLEGIDSSQLDALWLGISSAVVGEDLSISKNITGIRLADKCTDFRLVFRLEVWLDSDIKDTQEYAQFRDQVTSIFFEAHIHNMSQPLYKIHKVDKKPQEKKDEEKKQSST